MRLLCFISCRKLWLAIWFGAILMSPAGVAQEETQIEKPTAFSDDSIEFYRTRIKPIFEENCAACHVEDPDSFEGGLGITGRASLLRGGHSGPAIDLGNPEKSLLLLAVQHEVLKMPPDEQLPKNQIEDIKRWIEMGSPWDPAEDVDHGPAEKHSMVDEKARSWWSFQPVTRPEIPQPTNTAWSRNEIDQFVLAKLEESGLSPAKSADRLTLIRRATYDLLGLPPTSEEVDAFVNDQSPDAYEKLVERLLASPHYGEKWGRHWLDLVRYAESNSFERDGTKPFVWRYRDYVIRSFNDDKPYDQFLCEQLAGDELDQVTIDSMTATGYYRLGQWDDEPADPLQARFDELDDIVSTTSQSMLGLTINCARCHDHKIDPISQQDYYSLLAFFGNVRRYGERSQESVLDASVTEMRAPLEQQPTSAELKEMNDKIADVQKQLQEIEELAKQGFEPVEHEEFQYAMHKLRLLQNQVGTTIKEDDLARYRRLGRQMERLASMRDGGKVQILSVKEAGPELASTNIKVRGNPHIEGPQVPIAFPEVFGLGPISVTPKQHSSGARRALADWIASPANPLTARVMVNRIWQYHFGDGLVRSSSDYGYQGTPPTHPELLDWLASEFVASNWSIKAMHRKMMLSATYQMSGEFNPAAYAVDPSNHLLWRFKLRRLTAEELRDSILLAANRLNQVQMFGPSVFPEMPKEVLQGQSMPGDNWRNSPREQADRRSVYVHVKRSMQLPILATHDTADTDAACPVRFVTTQPTQSLTMLNSDFTSQAANAMAESITTLSPDRTRQIELAFERVTQRRPRESETQRLSTLLDDWTKQDGLTEKQAMQQLCLLMLNLNEFVYLD